MDDIVVPTHPTPDLICRRSSLVNTAKPVVLPLANLNDGTNTLSTSRKIDPVAVAVAAKAARPNDTYRRGSLDATVEYAVAMVNIVDPSLDTDDRNMCPFGTRRDSVCGNESPRSRRKCNWKQTGPPEEPAAEPGAVAVQSPFSLYLDGIENIHGSPQTRKQQMYFL
jgi:hypothetical protein